MTRLRCFFLQPTERVRVKLRRYTSKAGPCPLVPGKYSYHDVSTPFGEEDVIRDSHGYISNGLLSAPPHDDPRWPTQCACGYEFREDDNWQRDSHLIYRRADTGEEMTLYDAPTGAMWYAPWLDDFYTPQDAHNLMVKTPGGDWCVDSQSSNCTIPEDHHQDKHHCWVRTGAPPDVTAGKDGPTCSAGAGSIQAGSYHGFLRNGYLEEA